MSQPIKLKAGPVALEGDLALPRTRGLSSSSPTGVGAAATARATASSPGFSARSTSAPF
jgi:hypothetical protein